MAGRWVLVLGFAEPPGTNIRRSFGVESELRTASGQTLYASSSLPPAGWEALREGLLSGAVRTAALLHELPASEASWIMSEWRGRLVVHVDVLDALGPGHPGWEPENQDEDLLIVILTPIPPIARDAEAQSAAEFRASMASRHPTVASVDIAEVEASPRAWFGDLADESVGGATVLLSIARQDMDGGRVLLRNPAALGMFRIPTDNSLAARLRADGVRLECRGNEHAASGPGASGRERAPYQINLDLSAEEEDPVVVIPSGTVFEQVGIPTYQALATSGPAHATVSVGETASIVIPAWCLNPNLAPPRNQPMRLTPLRIVQQPSGQGEMWEDIRNRLASTRR